MRADEKDQRGMVKRAVLSGRLLEDRAVGMVGAMVFMVSDWALLEAGMSIGLIPLV